MQWISLVALSLLSSHYSIDIDYDKLNSIKNIKNFENFKKLKNCSGSKNNGKNSAKIGSRDLKLNVLIEQIISNNNDVDNNKNKVDDDNYIVDNISYSYSSNDTSNNNMGNKSGNNNSNDNDSNNHNSNYLEADCNMIFIKQSHDLCMKAISP